MSVLSKLAGGTLLDRWRKKQPEPKDMWAQLRELLDRYDKPKSDDVDKLDTLMKLLYLTPLDVEKLISALDSAKSLEATAGTLKASEADYAKIEAEQIAAEKAFETQMRSERSKLDAIYIRLENFRQAILQARRAAVDLREIQNQHRELFLLTDVEKAPVPEWFSSRSPMDLQRRLEAENILNTFPDFMPGAGQLDRVKGMMDKLQAEGEERRRKGENPPKPGQTFEHDAAEG